MWIGGNDICDIRANGPSVCWSNYFKAHLFNVSIVVQPEELALTYAENVKIALDYLKANVRKRLLTFSLELVSFSPR